MQIIDLVFLIVPTWPTTTTLDSGDLIFALEIHSMCRSLLVLCIPVAVIERQSPCGVSCKEICRLLNISSSC